MFKKRLLFFFSWLSQMLAIFCCLMICGAHITSPIHFKLNYVLAVVGSVLVVGAQVYCEGFAFCII